MYIFHSTGSHHHGLSYDAAFVLQNINIIPKNYSIFQLMGKFLHLAEGLLYGHT